MSAPTETQATPSALPELLLGNPAFVMLQLLRCGRKRAEERPGGPRLPSLMVLACIDEFGPQSQRELCRRLGLDPSDMVGIVDRLEADGHAVRERNPEDRRRHAIAMTPAGRAWLAEVSPELEARASRLLPGLTEAERETLMDLLLRALAHQDERVPDHYRTERSAIARDGNSEAS